MKNVSAMAKGILALVILVVPPFLSAANVHYQAVIQVQDSSSTSLGYVATDPNYWTPLLTPDQNSALVIEFTLTGTSGTAINLTQDNQTAPYLGPIQGRDSTSDDIGSGNFNYLYLDGLFALTAANATPQTIDSVFSRATGINKVGESAVWTIDINALTLVPVWVNSDGSKPATVVFVQSNHVYAGGDAGAFHSRFPAPVSTVTLHLVILGSSPVATDVSSQVYVTQSGFVRNRSTGLWNATMTVTNVSPSVIPGPIQVVFTNLTPGVTMANNTGLSGTDPYITASPSALPVGGSLKVPIQFKNPGNVFIGFTPITYSGVF
jgi:hypothetical protein